MNQEDKELLLKDLCAKQPWGVKVQYNNKVYAIDYVSAEYKEVKLDILDNYTVGISDIKAYLRPMSSMTEEEKDAYDTLTMCNAPWVVVNWLNANKFDYLGLIPKCLAIEVTEENNPYEKINL